MTDLSEVLFNDLRASRKNLNRLLGGAIIFALLGHFYILYPYIYYKSEERQANVALEGLRADRDRLERQLLEIRETSGQANEALDAIKDRAHGYPDHLRGVLPEIEQAIRARENPHISSVQQQARPSVRGLPLPEHVSDFNHGVRWYIENWFERLSKDIRARVIDPLMSLKEQEFRVELSALHAMAEQGMAGIHSYLDGLPPDFWRSYTGKGAVAEGLEQVIAEAFDPILAEVAELLKKVENDIVQQQEEFGRVEKRVLDIQEDWLKFESRLASLDSPFGRLPLGISDLIMLFPLLIVILTVMAAATIHNSSRLYLSLWTELSNQENRGNAALLKKYADCWYLPPYRNLFEPTALAAAFAILLGVFLHAALLVSGEKTLFTSLTGQSEFFRRAFFLAAYAVAAVVMLSLTAIVGRTLYRTSGRL